MPLLPRAAPPRSPLVREMPNAHALHRRRDRGPPPRPAARPLPFGAVRLRRHAVADPRGLAAGDDPHDGRGAARDRHRRDGGPADGGGRGLRDAPERPADDLPDDPARRGGAPPRRPSAGAAGVQAPLPRPADGAHRGAVGGAGVGGGAGGGVGGPRQSRPAGRAAAARCDAVPRQRHRPEVRPPRGRIARRGALLRRARLRSARRLRKLLEENDHRRDSPQPRAARRGAAGIRRRLRGDRGGEGGGRRGGGGGERRGEALRRQRLEARSAGPGRGGPGHPRVPQARAAGALPVRPTRPYGALADVSKYEMVRCPASTPWKGVVRTTGAPWFSPGTIRPRERRADVTLRSAPRASA